MRSCWLLISSRPSPAFLGPDEFLIPRAYKIWSQSSLKRKMASSNGGKAALPLIINNESIVTDNMFEVHNPATGELLYSCAGASVDDATRAVATAKAAFPSWSKTHPHERREIMNKAADIMLGRKEEFIKIQMEETGAGRLFVEKTFMGSVAFLKDFAGMITTVEGKSPVVREDEQSALVVKQPYGVVLGIAPWYVFDVSKPRVVGCLTSACF